VFADEAVEEGAEDVLFEVPAIDGATDVVGDLPDAAGAVVLPFGGGDGVFSR